MSTERFQDRKSNYPNRRKISIVSQTPNTIIADIERADVASIEGTPLQASVLNEWDATVTAAKTSANSAKDYASEAKQIASDAKAFVEALAQNPDCTFAGETGTPSVTFADIGGGKKKFVFKNLKGDTGLKGERGADGALINLAAGTGQSTTTAMTQKATTDVLNLKQNTNTAWNKDNLTFTVSEDTLSIETK